MLSYGFVKNSIIAVVVMQALSIASVHARESREGGERGYSQHHQGMQGQDMHQQGMQYHPNNQYHRDYSGQQGDQTHIWVNPNGGTQQQQYYDPSQPDNPLYDSEVQQAQQQGQ